MGSDAPDADAEQAAAAEHAPPCGNEAHRQEGEEAQEVEAAGCGNGLAPRSYRLRADERAAGTAQRHADTAAALTKASPEAAEQKLKSVQVQVGGGKYRSFKHEHLEDMDSAALLEAIAESKRCRDSLEGVPQVKCTVCEGCGSSFSEGGSGCRARWARTHE